MDLPFVLDTGGAGRISSDSPIIYCSSKPCFGDSEEEVIASSKSVTPRKFRRIAASKRYHENEKFAKIKPGCISPELREALHISHHDIPLHIYRMRSMGYPPGWLRKAKVERLPLFDGELELESSLEVKYNEDAIISYPGFNVCSNKLRDECYALQCPSIQRRHLLGNFISSLRNSSTNILESSLYKESLESKDLNDLEGERQRLLSEIKALKNSLSPTSGPSKLKEECKQLSEGCANYNRPTFPRKAPESGGMDADRISLNTEHASFNGSDHERGMRTDVTTLEAYHQEQVVQGNREQSDLESEEGTAIPQSISHAVANTDSGSYSANGKLNIPCAPKKLPELEAFSSGIQPFEPYKNLPNSQGAYNRVRNTLRRAKRDPDVFRKFGVPTEENTKEFPVMDGLAPRSELHGERHGWRQAVGMESCLNSSSGVENRLRRSNKEEVDNRACDIDDRHHHRRHFREEKLYFFENSYKCHHNISVLQEFDPITYRGQYRAHHGARNERYSLRDESVCGRHSRSSYGTQGSYFGYSTWRNTYYR